MGSSALVVSLPPTAPQRYQEVGIEPTVLISKSILADRRLRSRSGTRRHEADVPEKIASLFLSRNRSAPASRKRNALDTLHRLEAPLLVQHACRGIVTIKVPEKPLKLSDFLVANVVPYLEDGAVGPDISLGTPVTSKATSDSATRRHTHVNDLESLTVAAASRHMTIEHVDSAKSRRQEWNLCERDILEPTSNEPERTFWQVRRGERRGCERAIPIAGERQSWLLRAWKRRIRRARGHEPDPGGS